MNELQMKQCPFCGQFAMMEPDADPREVCGCDTATKYQSSCRVYLNRMSALEKLCGEECAKIHVDYQPVGERPTNC